jgi:hypothetical protein
LVHVLSSPSCSRKPGAPTSPADPVELLGERVVAAGQVDRHLLGRRVVTGHQGAEVAIERAGVHPGAA